MDDIDARVKETIESNSADDNANILMEKVHFLHAARGFPILYSTLMRPPVVFRAHIHVSSRVCGVTRRQKGILPGAPVNS
jgi:hypothetical protein